MLTAFKYTNNFEEKLIILRNNAENISKFYEEFTFDFIKYLFDNDPKISSKMLNTYVMLEYTLFQIIDKDDSTSFEKLKVLAPQKKLSKCMANISGMAQLLMRTNGSEKSKVATQICNKFNK